MLTKFRRYLVFNKEFYATCHTFTERKLRKQETKEYNLGLLKNKNKTCKGEYAEIWIILSSAMIIFTRFLVIFRNRKDI